MKALKNLFGKKAFSQLFSKNFSEKHFVRKCFLHSHFGKSDFVEIAFQKSF